MFAPCHINYQCEELNADRCYERYPDMISPSMEQDDGRDVEAEEPCCCTQEGEPCEAKDAATDEAQEFSCASRC